MCRGQLATDVTPGPCNPAVLGHTFQSGLSHGSGGRWAPVLGDTEKYQNRGNIYARNLILHSSQCFVQTKHCCGLYPTEFDGHSL